MNFIENEQGTTPAKQIQAKQSISPGCPTPEKKQRDPFVRAANEDDDGYDPWSDRKAADPLWEEDPWK